MYIISNLFTIISRSTIVRYVIRVLLPNLIWRAMSKLSIVSQEIKFVKNVVEVSLAKAA